jgi:hypothetical protein
MGTGSISCEVEFCVFYRLSLGSLRTKDVYIFQLSYRNARIVLKNILPNLMLFYAEHLFVAFKFTFRVCPSRHCDINTREGATKETRGKDGRTNFTLGVKELTLRLTLQSSR